MTGFRTGTWAHMRDFVESAEQVRRRIARLAGGGISLIVICVDRSTSDGGVDFFSDVTAASPGYPEWDPLKVMIESAHEQGIEVHPWLCVFKSGARAHLFEQHPEAEAIFSSVWPDGVSNQGSWTCAMQPLVQDYTFNLYRAIAERYEPDGLHMDYIRTGMQCSCDYCAAEMAKRGIDIRAVQRKYDDDRDLWLDTATHGLLRKHNARKVVGTDEEVDPVLVDEELHQWLNWRVDRLSEFVSRVTEYARAHGLESSAAVKHFWPQQTPTGAQDWVRWVREDLVDYLFPMTYMNDSQRLASVIAEHMELMAGTEPQYWPGLGKSSSISDVTPDQLAEQIVIAQQAGAAGVVIYHEAALTAEDLALLKDL